MTKPKIRVLLVYKDGVSSFVPEVEGLNPGGMCSAYEAMMDALIESTKLLEGIKSVTDDPKYLYEIEQQIEMNKYSALRKAGVEL